MKTKNMIDLFGTVEEKKHDWRNEWVGMPEYNNSKPLPPEVTAIFKFRNKADFDSFMDVVKDKLFNGKRVFDGKQKKNEYSAWYPLDPRPSENVYVVQWQKCHWCEKEADRLDYREIDGVTNKIKSCSECFNLDTKYLIDRKYGK